MKDLIDVIFQNGKVLQCICDAYESVSFLEDSHADNADVGKELYHVPFSVKHTYNTSKSLVDCIRRSLNVLPLGVHPSQYQIMKEILTKTTWDGLSCDDCIEIYGREKTNIYKYKKIARNTMHSSLEILIKSKFQLNKVDEKFAGLQNTEKNLAIYESIFYPEINRIDFQKLDYGNHIDDLLYVLINNKYYLTYINHYLQSIRNLTRDGRSYYRIAKLMVESQNRKQFKKKINMYPFFCQKNKSVIQYLNETENLLGIMIFGVNYLFLKGGFYLTEKKQ